MDNKLNTSTAIELTKKILHDYFNGKMDLWISSLSDSCVWIGSGDQMLFGKPAIQKFFKRFEGTHLKISVEDYFSLTFPNNTIQIYGKIAVINSISSYHTTVYFTFIWQMIQQRPQIIYHHFSYEASKMDDRSLNGVKLNLNTRKFVRNLLLESPITQRLLIRSGKQNLFVDPNAIIYVESFGKKTELVCIDRVIVCNYSIGKIKDILPEGFYPVHRSYLINTFYITGLHRYEVEMISDITIPIPALNYMQVKEDLAKIIEERKET